MCGGTRKPTRNLMWRDIFVLNYRDYLLTSSIWRNIRPNVHGRSADLYPGRTAKHPITLVSKTKFISSPLSKSVGKGHCGLEFKLIHLVTSRSECCPISKVTEIFIHARLEEFTFCNNILQDLQQGFRRKHGGGNQLRKVVEILSDNLNQGQSASRRCSGVVWSLAWQIDLWINPTWISTIPCTSGEVCLATNFCSVYVRLSQPIVKHVLESGKAQHCLLSF